VLDVEVVVGQSSLGGLVLGEDLVELTHLRLQKLAAQFKLADFSGVLDHTVVKAEFLRLKDSSLGLDLIALSSCLHLAGLLVNEFGLVGNPSFLDANDFSRKLLSLLLHVTKLVLERTGILVIFATAFNFEISKLSVKLIDLKLLLGDINLVLLLELLLLFDFLLFSSTLSFKFLQFILKEVILLLGV